MRAAVIEAMERPPSIGEADAPVRGDGQVLIEVTAATLNPVELHIWRGRFRDGEPIVPYVPGVEGVGRVVEGGRFAPGTRVRFEVIGLHPGYGDNGSMAELALASEDIVTELPDDVPDTVAAALGTTGITAMRILDVAELVPGEGVVVLGASGLVGRSAVQLARALGAARIVAVGRSPDGLARAVELGADASVALNGQSKAALADSLHEASEGRIDVIVDPLWGEPALAALIAASRDVRHVNVGRAAGDPVSLSHALLLSKRAILRGLSTAMDPWPVRRDAYERLLGFVRAGAFQVDHDVMSLDEIGAAWELQASSPGRKLVVTI